MNLVVVPWFDGNTTVSFYDNSKKEMNWKSIRICNCVKVGTEGGYIFRLHCNYQDSYLKMINPNVFSCNC